MLPVHFPKSHLFHESKAGYHCVCAFENSRVLEFESEGVASLLSLIYREPATGNERTHTPRGINRYSYRTPPSLTR